MEIEARTGLLFVGDGVEQAPALTDGCAVYTQDMWGKFGAAARKGYVFSAETALTGVTVAAANVSPLPAGTGQPIVGLFNPVGSGVMIHVLRAKIWSISGTPNAGTFAWNGCMSPGISAAGVLGVNHKSFLLNSTAKVFINAATTGSIAGVPVRALGPSNFAAALAASAGQLFAEEYTEGDIVAVPGALIGLAAPGAGTTWVVGASLTWVEVPATA